jgi:hypothetical protein
METDLPKSNLKKLRSTEIYSLNSQTNNITQKEASEEENLEAYLREKLLQCKKKPKRTMKNRKKSKFKEKGYGYDLWKLLQKLKKYQKMTIKKLRIRLKWNHYN